MRGCVVVDHSNVELLACPFCGRPAAIAGKRATRFPGSRKVSCSHDGCGAHFSYWHPDEWNRRAERSAQTEQQHVVLEGWRAGVEAVAAMIEKKADDYAAEFGHIDMGALSFGIGHRADIKRDHHSSLVELAEEVRTMLAAPIAQTEQNKLALHRAITHYEAALQAAFPSGSPAHVSLQWDEARRQAKPDTAQTAPQPELSGLVEALVYYANGDHMLLADPDAWDTCSGEPLNFLHDEAGTASVEDGTIAKAALDAYRAALSANGGEA